MDTNEKHIINGDSTDPPPSSFDKEKSDVQYQNLVNQLNPHFLFNSLATLESLIHSDQKLATKFLNQLTRVYRYVLSSNAKRLVLIEDELKFMRDYADLLQTRFGKGLVVSLEVTLPVPPNKIVPTALQILVENATRHNITDIESPLTVRVTVQNHFLVVENNLQRKNIPETKRLMGLQSLRSLYTYLSTVPVEIQETEHFFIVKLPLL
ncbi:MAG: histidine kinase [Spirosomataceae bacterium]